MQPAAGGDIQMSAWLADIVPELVLAAAVVVLLPLAPSLPERRRSLITWLALAALAAAGVAAMPLLGGPARDTFDGTYAVDPFAAFIKLVAIVATMLVLLTTRAHFRGSPREADVPTMLLLACLGIVGLAASQNLALIALFLTLVTVASFVLTGIAKEDRLAAEGALKLFLFGSVAAAVMFYGMSLLYGLTGTLQLPEIAARLPTAPRVAAIVALALVIAGYAFKVTLVPFHLWVPDTYQGAPTAITAFLSVAPKAAGIAVLLRTLALASPNEVAISPQWMAALAALTMTLGNLLALRQTNVKRLLAYSSIAQAGYLLMGIAALERSSLAVPGLLVYLAVYVAMNLAAFLAVAAVGRATGSDEMPRYAGLAGLFPMTALALALSVVALAGIPPMASYVGKAMLFLAAMDAGLAWLAWIAAANSALSLYYYARLLEVMYLRGSFAAADGAAIVGTPGEPSAIRAEPATLAVSAVAATVTLLLGIVPQPLVALAEQASVLLRP